MSECRCTSQFHSAKCRASAVELLHSGASNARIFTQSCAMQRAMSNYRRLSWLGAHALLSFCFACSSSNPSQNGGSSGSSGDANNGHDSTTGGAASAGGSNSRTSKASGGADESGGADSHESATTRASGGSGAGSKPTRTSGQGGVGGASLSIKSGNSAVSTEPEGGGGGTDASASGGSQAKSSTRAAGGGGASGGATQASATQGSATAIGGSSGTIKDCAGHAVSLSANGSASDSDAANAHLEMDLKTDLPIGNANRTVEFWAFIKSTDWVGEKNQIFYYGGSGSNASFGLDFGTNTVSGSTTNHATLNPFTGSDIRDDSGKDLGIESSTNQWVHIAMTWDGAILTTYVNGLPKITVQGSGAATTLATTQSALSLGCNPTNSQCFSGMFDELRFWSVARSATEIKDNYDKTLKGSEAGLVGYWKFDEAAGATSAADAVSTTGHTAHTGALKADSATHNPTFVAPNPPVPIVCP